MQRRGYPSSFTIFNLELPMDLLPELDCEWLLELETSQDDAELQEPAVGF